MRIEVEAGGVRLDVFLAEHAGSRSAAERLVNSGAVTVNGRAERVSYKVKPGDAVEFDVPEPETTDILPEDIPLDVVYEDGDILIVNKPKGMVVHPAPGHYSGTLVNALLHHCGDNLAGIGGALRPGIVHRIDKDTSGLLAVAKNDAAHRKLSAQLAGRTLSRVYETVIVGAFRENSGTINLPVGRHPRDRKKMAVVSSGGRSAVTHWELIARYSGCSHLRCKLETGRTHQIRVHLAARGHPVLGDALYGSAKNPFGLDGQCLHARELRLVHPRTGEEMRFEAPLPEYFTHVLEKLEAQF